MIQGEVEQLRNLIDVLHAAIERKDVLAIYDTVSQVSALYGDAVPKLDDAFDVTLNATICAETTQVQQII